MRNGLRFLRNTAVAGVWLCITFAAGHNIKRVLYYILKMLVMKGLNNFETAVVIKSSILC